MMKDANQRKRGEGRRAGDVETEARCNASEHAPPTDNACPRAASPADQHVFMHHARNAVTFWYT